MFDGLGTSNLEKSKVAKNTYKDVISGLIN